MVLSHSKYCSTFSTVIKRSCGKFSCGVLPLLVRHLRKISSVGGFPLSHSFRNFSPTVFRSINFEFTHSCCALSAVQSTARQFFSMFLPLRGGLSQRVVPHLVCCGSDNISAFPCCGSENVGVSFPVPVPACANRAGVRRFAFSTSNAICSCCSRRFCSAREGGYRSIGNTLRMLSPSPESSFKFLFVCCVKHRGSELFVRSRCDVQGLLARRVPAFPHVCYLKVFTTVGGCAQRCTCFVPAVYCIIGVPLKVNWG